MSDLPDKIYLLDMGGEVAWCDHPAPGINMETDDSVEYVKASVASAQLTTITEERSRLRDALNEIAALSSCRMDEGLMIAEAALTHEPESS